MFFFKLFFYKTHLIVARLREPRDSNVGILENKSTLLTISRLWRYCGPSNYRFNFLLYWYAPWVFFEVVNVLSCSPLMFENTENKQLDWRIRHSHLASKLFHSLFFLSARYISVPSAVHLWQTFPIVALAWFLYNINVRHEIHKHLRRYRCCMKEMRIVLIFIKLWVRMLGRRDIDSLDLLSMIKKNHIATTFLSSRCKMQYM